MGQGICCRCERVPAHAAARQCWSAMRQEPDVEYNVCACISAHYECAAPEASAGFHLQSRTV